MGWQVVVVLVRAGCGPKVVLEDGNVGRAGVSSSDLTRPPFEAEAVAGLEDAAVWYEEHGVGYGALFVAEVRRAVERAADLPRSGL